MKRYLLPFMLVLIVVGVSFVFLYKDFEKKAVEQGSLVLEVENLSVSAQEEASLVYLLQDEKGLGAVEVELPVPDGFELVEGSVQIAGVKGVEVLGGGWVAADLGESTEGVTSYQIVNMEDEDVDLSEFVQENEAEVVEEDAEEGVDGEATLQVTTWPSSKLYTNVDNYLEFGGAGLGQVEAAVFINADTNEEYSVYGVRTENGVGFNLGRYSLAEGEYAVLLRTEAQDFDLDFTLMVLEQDGPLVLNVTPNEGSSAEDNLVVLQGSGFDEVFGIQLSNGTVLSAAAFEILDNKILTVKIPAGLNVGTYRFRLITEEGFFESSDVYYTVNNL